MRLFIKNTLAIAIILFSCLPLCAGEISFKITKKYLNFPISHQTDRARMRFEIDGKQERSFVIRLAPNDADYWVFCDVTALKGKTIKISYDGDAAGLDKIYQDDKI